MAAKQCLGALGLALLFQTSAAFAADSDWFKARTAQFAAWQAAHPGLDAKLADLKSGTAALAAAYGPPPAAVQEWEDDPAANNPPVVWRVPGAPSEIWDSAEAPKMAIIPAGEYTTGIAGQARGLNEGRHRIRIGAPLAVGELDVTRGEFARFVAETGYNPINGGCLVFDGKDYFHSDTFNWKNPGFRQTDTDPVVCVSWYDASVYANWLSHKTGHSYRLLSEAEWEYAARGGTTTYYYWGDTVGKGNANCDGCGSRWDSKQTSPGGSFAPNPFGLYDMSGNVWQWTGNCFDSQGDVYLPAGETSTFLQACGDHTRRGGSWDEAPRYLRSAYGFGDNSVFRLPTVGFRLARAL